VDTARNYENIIGSDKVKWHMTNLVDQVWPTKPTPSIKPIETLSEEFSGLSVAEKLENVRKELEASGADALVLSALDEIAWLFNIRGTGDIEYNPVVFSYAIVEKTSAHIFIDSAKISAEVMEKHFKASNIHALPYESFFGQLETLPKAGKKIWLDPATSNWAVFTTARSGALVEKRSPVVMAKARKNAVELAGMKRCHIRDGAALVEFFSWLEAQITAPGYNGELTEDGVTHKQIEFRRKQDRFRGLSFGTISGTGPNAAIIHYHAPHEGSAKILRNQIYLNDSGAQYLDGTTDVTRTWHFGTPSTRERECFTRVVQGVINLSMAVFPKGTNGYVLDVLARRALWEAGLDFNHGTGHGVGHYLNVHEWPPRISCQERAKDRAMQPLEPGFVTSNEPGYYENGAFGIRIENLMFVKEVKTANNFDGMQFYGFEQLTMCPIQKSLLEPSLMEKREIDWLNAYHKQVWDNVSPLVQQNDSALAWLQRATAPL
jgi:Xaa-Pro aminopeptidase